MLLDRSQGYRYKGSYLLGDLCTVIELKEQVTAAQRLSYMPLPHLLQGSQALQQVVPEWDLSLQLGSNDCHTYTNALISQMCGIQDWLSNLGIPGKTSRPALRS